MDKRDTAGLWCLILALTLFVLVMYEYFCASMSPSLYDVYTEWGDINLNFRYLLLLKSLIGGAVMFLLLKFVLFLHQVPDNKQCDIIIA